MDWMMVYICTIYVFVLCASVHGAFSPMFEANLIQKIGLLLFAFWAAWRIEIIVTAGWGYPHEPVVATAMALYAGGTIRKAFHYQKSRQEEDS